MVVFAALIVLQTITCSHNGLYIDGTRIETPVQYNFYTKQLHWWPIRWGEVKKTTRSKCELTITSPGYYELYVTAQAKVESKPTKKVKFIARPRFVK